MKSAVIYRHQIFKQSEPFITAQAQSLTRYRPLYVGRERMGKSPTGADVVALSDKSEPLAGAMKLVYAATRNPQPYRKLLSGRRPALIHAHFGVDGVYALPLAKSLGIPLITTFHGFDATLSTRSLLTSGSPALINYALFRRSLARQGRLFLCVSEFIRNKIKSLGFPEDRAQLHYIGIDVSSMSLRDALEERHIIVHVARLVEKKGTRYLLEAFAKCLQRHPEFRLVIIGDGPLRAKLEALARELSLGEKVRFEGALAHAEVLAWIRKACALVLPSVYAATGDAEGLGMVLLEAAAQGVPLLGTRHGGIPEVIEDGITGFLVNERDVAGLSNRLSALMGDAELRRRMGLSARTMVETRFDICKQTARLESLYDQVIACRKKS